MQVDRSMLRPVVQQAMGSDTIEVVDWQHEAVHGGLMGATVYRLFGTASDQGAVVPWAVILKVVRPNPHESGATELIGANWRREPLAFASGLLNKLPGRLTAPRCLGVVERSSDEIWIWLEEVRGQPGTEWSRQRIVLGARHLGQFNGAYLVGECLPSAPWLMRDMLRRWIAHLTASVEQLLEELSRGHPLLQRGWPTDVGDALSRLWTEREIFTESLDRLPQTFCHHDANGRNLIARRSTNGDEQTVAVDWDFAGIGPPGYELVPLCGELLPAFRFGLAEARDLAEDVFEGYLAGLRDAGWQGDQGLVRFGFTAALALRYGACGGPANLSDLLDETRHWVPEQRWGHSIVEIMDRWAGCSRFMLGLAEEARGLLARLS